MLTAAVALMLIVPPVQTPSIGCKGTGYGELDFWIGEWEVVDAHGVVAGTNIIRKELGGCVIHEEWTGASGTKGRSVNIYDPVKKRWHQTWVDNTGLLLMLDGEFTDGTLRFSGRSASPTGPAMNRMTLTPLQGGGLRQVWNVSTDDGKTWLQIFDGSYRRTPKSHSAHHADSR